MLLLVIKPRSRFKPHIVVRLATVEEMIVLRKAGHILTATINGRAASVNARIAPGMRIPAPRRRVVRMALCVTMVFAVWIDLFRFAVGCKRAVK